jgi:hypothetical protein
MRNKHGLPTNINDDINETAPILPSNPQEEDDKKSTLERAQAYFDQHPYAAAFASPFTATVREYQYHNLKRKVNGLSPSRLELSLVSIITLFSLPFAPLVGLANMVNASSGAKYCPLSAGGRTYENREKCPGSDWFTGEGEGEREVADQLKEQLKQQNAAVGNTRITTGLNNYMNTNNNNGSQSSLANNTDHPASSTMTRRSS